MKFHARGGNTCCANPFHVWEPRREDPRLVAKRSLCPGCACPAGHGAGFWGLWGHPPARGGSSPCGWGRKQPQVLFCLLEAMGMTGMLRKPWCILRHGSPAPGPGCFGADALLRNLLPGGEYRGRQRLRDGQCPGKGLWKPHQPLSY